MMPALFKEGKMMKNLNSGKHLTHEERKIIEAGIRNGATKTAIGKTIGKEKSTVGKEIKLHRNILISAC